MKYHVCIIESGKTASSRFKVHAITFAIRHIRLEEKRGQYCRSVLKVCLEAVLALCQAMMRAVIAFQNCSCFDWLFFETDGDG